MRVLFSRIGRISDAPNTENIGAVQKTVAIRNTKTIVNVKLIEKKLMKIK